MLRVGTPKDGFAVKSSFAANQLHDQRTALKSGGTEHNRILLFSRNSDFINADSHRWVNIH